MFRRIVSKLCFNVLFPDPTFIGWKNCKTCVFRTVIQFSLEIIYFQYWSTTPPPMMCNLITTKLRHCFSNIYTMTPDTFYSAVYNDLSSILINRNYSRACRVNIFQFSYKFHTIKSAHVENTVFTRMQDESNQRWPPESLLKNIWLNFIHLIYTSCHILSTFTNQCHSLHLHSHTFIFLTLTANIPFLFTAFPQHIISLIHCIGCTTFLKTLHIYFWWDVLPYCYDPHWSYNTFTFLGLWTYLNPWRRMTISPQIVLVVLRIWICVLDFSVVSVV